MGGIDVVNEICWGTPESIRRARQERMEVYKYGGSLHPRRVELDTVGDAGRERPGMGSRRPENSGITSACPLIRSTQTLATRSCVSLGNMPTQTKSGWSNLDGHPVASRNKIEAESLVRLGRVFCDNRESLRPGVHAGWSGRRGAVRPASTGPYRRPRFRMFAGPHAVVPPPTAHHCCESS